MISKLLVAAALLTGTIAAHADTLITSTDGEADVYGAEYEGQAFTLPGTGTYDDITFNFYTDGAPVAFGTGYLFTTEYTGTPAGLSSGAGLLGTATSGGGVYTFDPSLTLDGGSTYYFYEDGYNNNGIDGISSYALPNYYADDGTTYYSDASSDFTVTGAAPSSVTPEPSSFALLGTGMLAVAGTLRKRFA